MFNRIHQKLGTAGFIISIVALVAALGGGAYAASAKLNSTQKKEVEKISKKYAGKNGTNGANGAAGAKGDKGEPGTAGTNGTDGTNGESVTVAAASNAECPAGGTKFSNKTGSGKACNGTNGTTGFTETLPSGKTETGVWSVSTSSVGFEELQIPISFPIPLSQPGEQNSAFGFKQKETENGEFGLNAGIPCKVGEPSCVDTGCKGSVIHPTAPAGKLCVYTAAEEKEGSGAKLRELRNLEFEGFRYSPTGAVLVAGAFEASTEEPGRVFAAGTWAVTAK
jgi:hypothetical protein